MSLKLEFDSNGRTVLSPAEDPGKQLEILPSDPGKQLEILPSDPGKEESRERHRLQWIPELCDRFESAVERCGGLESAKPKPVHETMDIKGLTVSQIKSRLQFCRNEAKKQNGGQSQLLYVEGVGWKMREEAKLDTDTFPLNCDETMQIQKGEEFQSSFELEGHQSSHTSEPMIKLRTSEDVAIMESPVQAHAQDFISGFEFAPHNIFNDGWGESETFNMNDIEDKGDEIADDCVDNIANDGDDVLLKVLSMFNTPLDLLEGHESFNALYIGIGALRNDSALRDLLERILQAITAIQVIGIEEAFNSTQDQSIIALGFFNSIAECVEFYFRNGETMAKVVGVGMLHSKAIFKPGSIFDVQEIEKKEWENIWTGVKSGSDTTGMLLKVTLPTTSTQESTSTASNNTFQVPFFGELSKYFIVRKALDAICIKSKIGMSRGRSEIHSTEDRPRDASGAGTNSMVEATKEALKEAITDYFSNMTLGSSHPSNNKKNQEGDSGSGDGNDRGDDSHCRGKSPTDLLKDKLHTTKVNVIFLSGGDFFDKDSGDPFLDVLQQSSLSYERLENVKITPYLTLDFCKIMASEELLREIQITVGNVFFALHRDCDDLNEACGRFGWFHDELFVSFGPYEKGIEVYLKGDYKAEGFEPGKTINKASQLKVNTTNFQKGLQIKGVLGNNNVGRVEVGGDLSNGTSDSDHRSNEHSLESPCIQTTGGFYILPKPILHEARLEYQYKAPFRNVAAKDFLDPSFRDQVSTSALCSVQTTKFSGTWVPEGYAEGAVYVFQATRNLREIQRTEIEMKCNSSTSMPYIPRIFKRKKLDDNGKNALPEVETYIWEQPAAIQKYKKKLYINHAMTHLVDRDTFRLLERPNSRLPLWRGGDPLANLSPL